MQWHAPVIPNYMGDWEGDSSQVNLDKEVCKTPSQQKKAGHDGVPVIPATRENVKWAKNKTCLQYNKNKKGQRHSSNGRAPAMSLISSTTTSNPHKKSINARSQDPNNTKIKIQEYITNTFV
jgi:hypothetical protein